MHTLIHWGLQIAFLCVISIVFTLFVAKHPSVEKKWSRGKWIGILFVGFVIGAVFLVSGTLYVIPT